jgi:hypothetical protein
MDRHKMEDAIVADLSPVKVTGPGICVESGAVSLF